MNQLKRGVLHANASVVTLIQRISDALLIGMLLGIIGLLRQQSWTLQHWVVMLGIWVCWCCFSFVLNWRIFTAPGVVPECSLKSVMPQGCGVSPLVV